MFEIKCRFVSCNVIACDNLYPSISNFIFVDCIYFIRRRWREFHLPISFVWLGLPRSLVAIAIHVFFPNSKAFQPTNYTNSKFEQKKSCKHNFNNYRVRSQVSTRVHLYSKSRLFSLLTISSAVYFVGNRLADTQRDFCELCLVELRFA